MKVELEVSNTQLEALDKDLTTFLSTLTDDQKLTLLGKYLETQFQGIYSFDNSWGQRTLTEFGRKIIDGLQDKIANLYIENYYLNNEELKEKLDKYVEDIKKSLPDIVRESIANYITRSLFHSTDEISFMISGALNHYINEQSSNGGY